MIKILTHEEHKNGKRIMDRYLYMAAYVLPFSPEDVLGTDRLEVDGEVVTAGNFMKVSNKKPRKRTEGYNKLLGSCKNIRRYTDEFLQDQFLAAHIIRESNKELYFYLYENNPLETNPQSCIVNRKNLRKLLTVKMDELDAELEQIKEKSRAGSKTMNNEMLDVVFRYSAFAQKNVTQKNDAVKLLKDMDVSVCPYCNRQYTFTVSHNGHTSRPQFDHFLPKDRYPCFAVSLYNLIPSCGLCNQAKSDNEDRILYPYSEEMGYDVSFETRYKSGFRYLFGDKNAKDEFDIKLVKKNLNKEFDEKVDNSIKYFNLELLYEGHKDYVLSLYQKNYVFSDAYIDMLCKEFPDLLPSKQEIKSLLYLMDIEKEHWGERTLGKLTHDIDLEINSEVIF